MSYCSVLCTHLCLRFLILPFKGRCFSAVLKNFFLNLKLFSMPQTTTILLSLLSVMCLVGKHYVCWSFRLVPNSVTLDDLEQRNSPNGRIISRNSVASGADYVKVVEDTPISYSDFSRGSPHESIKVRQSPLGRENLTNNQP